MTENAPRIALLPLDDRPVNVLLPQDVARVAGYSVDVPPEAIMPSYRTAGDPVALGEWLTERAADPATKHLVVSLDMLCYGGLIASRTSADSTRTALAQLDVLRDIRALRHDLEISAVSLVMRASNSYSAAEEPEYWTSYGKELHALGGDIQRVDGSRDIQPLNELTPVPAEVVSDFAARRVRNHIVNLSALTLVEDATLDFLAITADDTAEFSAGSAEQAWLRHWMRFLPSGREVLMYPGADEVGAALVARAVARGVDESAVIRLVCPDPAGLDRVPPYENVPLAESVNRQVHAAGARLVSDGDAEGPDADAVLVVHAPDPARHDMFRGYPERADDDAVRVTVEAVRRELARGNMVAVADVRFPNGADAALLWRLAREGLLSGLVAFGGWNTAGNTLGSVIAVVVAAIVGRKTGRLNEDAVQQALLTRLLDDFAYQAVIRTEDGPSLFPDHLPMADDRRVAQAEAHIAERMRRMLSEDLPGSEWRLTRLTLPWRRSFEVGIALEKA
jgi:hypothetical protein